MENENKIKLLKEKLSSESEMNDEEYKQILVDYCNEIDKEPSANITKEIMDIAKKMENPLKRSGTMMNKKAEILNDLLEKGYISQETYREKLLDEKFSDNDAAMFHHIAKAYAEADETSYPISLFRKKYAKWLA